jgi:hypothetical protein
MPFGTQTVADRLAIGAGGAASKMLHMEGGRHDSSLELVDAGGNWRVYDRGMNLSQEPDLATDPALTGILGELAAREPIFHRPEWGTTRADLERMTCDDFWEVGASGRCYSRAYVLDELEKRLAAPHDDLWETSGMTCRELAPDVYLLTYTLLQNGARKTRRSTIWRRTAEGWKIVFHQGTMVAGE